MLNQADLSLEQAPPISVPFRFFLTAPLFGILAGLLLAYYGPEALASRWSPVTLALSHLLTLGCLGLIMCGAMMQMLPVLAGSPVPGVGVVATLVHLLLTAGTLALAAGFISGSALLQHLAMSALGGGLLLFIGATAIALKRIKLPNTTITGMRFAVGSLAVTAILGVTLITAVTALFPVPQPLALTDIHAGWGFLGWVGLLVAGVAYQVVPLFQITAEYPRWMTRTLTTLLFLSLIIWAPLRYAGAMGEIPPLWADYWLLLPATGYGLFAATTLSLQQRRRRRLSDASLIFWRLSMAGLVAAALLWTAGLFPDIAHRSEYPFLLGACLLLGFALPVANGMLYKIVPFLSWFHLQNRQLALMQFSQVKVPNMKELLPNAWADRQLLTYLALLATTPPAIFWPHLFARPAGLLLALSSALLWLNLFRAVLHYRDVNRRFTVPPTPV